MPKHWEVIVERRITNRFTVEGRTRSEAAAVVGMALGRDDPWSGTAETEISRRLLEPKAVTLPVAAPNALDFDALRRGENLDDEPLTADEIAARAAGKSLSLTGEPDPTPAEIAAAQAQMVEDAGRRAALRDAHKK